MEAFIDYIRDFNLVTVILRLVCAAFCGGVIGIERGKQRRAAGLRTHILVSLGAALTATIGFYCISVLGISTDPLRVSAQVISGIGFLGVGTILLKGRFQITGLTTAAGLWVTAAIGLAFGVGFYEGGIITFIISVITVAILQRLERRINSKQANYGVYVEIKGDENVGTCVDFLKEAFKAHDIQVTVPRSGIQNNVGIEASVIFLGGDKVSLDEVIGRLKQQSYVVFAIESL